MSFDFIKIGSDCKLKTNNKSIVFREELGVGGRKVNFSKQ